MESGGVIFLRSQELGTSTTIPDARHENDAASALEAVAMSEPEGGRGKREISAQDPF
jgi:hypothetical protein